MTTENTAQESVEYHYITTVQTPGGALNTRDGLITVPSGYSRAECFRHLVNQLMQEYGQISVLYFALEPNRL